MNAPGLALLPTDRAPRATPRDRTRAIGAAAVLMTLVACGAKSDAGAYEQSEAPAAARAAYTEAEMASDDKAMDDPTTPDLPARRMVIRNAHLQLRAESPDEVAAAATRLAEQVGGFVASSDTQGVGEAIAQVDASLRVPADRFESVMAQLRAQGELLQETITGEDVTEQHADLDARLRSQRTMEERLLTILAKVETVEDALAVEAQLVGVRTEIERLDARKRTMEDRVAMATITLVVSAPNVANPQPAETVASRLDRAVDDAGRLFVGGVAGLIRTIGALLPLGLVFGPLGLVGRRWWRRRKAQRALVAAAPMHRPPQG